MIKLIVSDIDGTLVPDGSHEMNPELLDVIMKIRENGVQFAAASGRQWASIESIFGPIKEKVFYLSDNGAYVGCHGRNLFLNPIDRETVMDMVRDVRRMEGLEVMLSGPDGLSGDGEAGFYRLAGGGIPVPRKTGAGFDEGGLPVHQGVHIP